MTIENEHQLSQSSTESFLEELRRCLKYGPVRGKFINRATGREIGNYRDDGYIQIYFKGKIYLGHRLAWFYCYGEWTLLDHKKGRSISIFNLRRTTPQQNSRNRSVNCTNLLGIKGVQQRGNSYRAYITVDGRNISLGTFKTLDRAVDARKIAEAKYFGEFAYQED